MYQPDKLSSVEDREAFDLKNKTSASAKVKALGLCLGASTISLVAIESESQGFKNGWVSSTAVTHLTRENRISIPARRLSTILESSSSLMEIFIFV